MGDGTEFDDALSGLPGFRVLAVTDDGGELLVGIETMRRAAGYPACGVIARTDVCNIIGSRCSQSGETDVSDIRRVIWQYWETRGSGSKPAFIDGLHSIARRNSGCQVELVTPQTLSEYIPDLPDTISRIDVMAHKADMIRAMLVARHGGMWLDSDAIVLRDLNWLFDLLDTYEFVCFNEGGRLEEGRPLTVNCFLSRPEGIVINEWVRQQHGKFPKTKFGWDEIGSDLLSAICLAETKRVKAVPFELICPITWDQVSRFGDKSADLSTVLSECFIVMLSNFSLRERAPAFRRLTCGQIANADNLLGSIMRAALRGDEVDRVSPTVADRIRALIMQLRDIAWRVHRRIGSRRGSATSSRSA
jgi:hypothetical protein